MTVKELREALKTFPEDQDVLFADYEGGPTDIVELDTGYHWTGKGPDLTKPYVLLRG